MIFRANRGDLTTVINWHHFKLQSMLKTKFYDDRQRDGRRDLLSKLKLWKFPIDGLFVLVASDSSFRHGNQSKTINLLRRQRMAEAGRMTGHSVLF